MKAGLEACLSIHCNSHATGCLSFEPADRSFPGRGMIFLRNGRLVYAEVYDAQGTKRGLEALIPVLRWGRLESSFDKTRQAPRIDFDLPMTTALARVDALAKTRSQPVNSPPPMATAFAQFSAQPGPTHTASHPPSHLAEAFMPQAPAQPTEAPREHIVLEIQNGEQAGQCFVVDREWVLVGRHPACDFVIMDPTVSSKHCYLTPEGHSLKVVDLGSSNGTFINNQKIQKGEVLPESILRLGKTIIFVYFPSQPVPDQPGAVIDPRFDSKGITVPPEFAAPTAKPEPSRFASIQPPAGSSPPVSKGPITASSVMSDPKKSGAAGKITKITKISNIFKR